MLSLTAHVSESLLILEWGMVTDAEEMWVYGDHVSVYFEPGVFPGYEYRLAVLPGGTTEWSASMGVGDPEINWIYCVLAVDTAEQVLYQSNQAGEHDFNLSMGLPQSD